MDSSWEWFSTPVLGTARREVDQRLLLGQRRQHPHRRFQPGQLAVRVEDVELGFVSDERGPGIFSAVGIAGIGLDRQFAGLADVEALDHLRQPVAVRGEVLRHLHGCAERHDRHQVRGSHLLAEELQSGLLRADLLLRLHGREIEEQHQQPLVLVLDPAGGLHVDRIGARRHRGRGRRSRCRYRHRLRLFVGDALEFEDRDLLRLAVLENREVFFLQGVDRLAVLGANEDVHHHQLRGRLERGDLLLLPRQAERQENGCCEPVHAESPGQNL